MRLFSTMYLCTSHPPEAVWKMVPSSRLVVPESTMNGRNMSDENSVLRNSTGMTALPSSDFFLNES